MTRPVARNFALLVAVFGLLGTAAIAFAGGFRPPSEFAGQFVDAFPTATIVVFPTVVRDSYIERYSLESRDLAIRLLDEHGAGAAQASDSQLYLGKLSPTSQYEMFQGSLRAMAAAVRSEAIEADYVLLVDVVFPPLRGKRLEVFGIHVYILTPGGDNAFSIILNSHHESFRAAGLNSRNTTAKGKEQLAVRATTVAVEAVMEQLADAKACAAREAGKSSVRPVSDVIDDFDTGLVQGTDDYGIPTGFSTFAGPKSRVNMSTTNRHLPIPGQAAGNSVLEVKLEVESWAGVLQRFASDTTDDWIAYDWRGAKELSFWIYGHASGTMLVVDVLDNRNRCSMVDDAERYSYSFTDDFEGWKLVSIPFEVMSRKDIGNGAPDDGLGLARVHGWGIATLDTSGRRTCWIDDVRLRYTPLLDDMPPGLSRDEDVWVPVNELPMYGGFEKTERQREADATFLETVLPRFDDDRAAAADYFAREAWKSVYSGDNATAMKRFNQAWLLDPDNPVTLWGFAAICRVRGNTDAALRYYEQAIEHGGNWPKLEAEYGELRNALDGQ